MNNIEKHILNDVSDLKNMPFSTPEGYFESLKVELKAIPAKQDSRPKVRKWTPQILQASIAAAVAAILIMGGFFLGRVTEQYADVPELTQDDIIEYLIYSGFELEDIEQY